MTEEDLFRLVLGALVQHQRLRGGRGQEELAAASGISQPTLSRIERGRSCPDAWAVWRLEAALGLPAGTLFTKVHGIIEQAQALDGMAVERRAAKGLVDFLVGRRPYLTRLSPGTSLNTMNTLLIAEPWVGPDAWTCFSTRNRRDPDPDRPPEAVARVYPWGTDNFHWVTAGGDSGVAATLTFAHSAADDALVAAGWALAAGLTRQQPGW